MDPHKFQKTHAKEYGGKILNVGCKEDPAGIGECGDVTNMDMFDTDVHTGQNMSGLPGFIKADFLLWQPDESFSFDVIILGEVLEHCDDQRFNEMLARVYMNLKEDGHFIITVPHDPRTKHEQYGRTEEYFEIRPGVTSWHQNVVTLDYLKAGLHAHGFKVHTYERHNWDYHKDMYWHNVVAVKNGEKSTWTEGENHGTGN